MQSRVIVLFINIFVYLNDDDDDDETMKLVFAHSYSLKTVTSVLMMICSSKQFSFQFTT